MKTDHKCKTKCWGEGYAQMAVNVRLNAGVTVTLWHFWSPVVLLPPTAAPVHPWSPTMLEDWAQTADAQDSFSRKASNTAQRFGWLMKDLVQELFQPKRKIFLLTFTREQKSLLRIRICPIVFCTHYSTSGSISDPDAAQDQDFYFLFHN